MAQKIRDASRKSSVPQLHKDHKTFDLVFPREPQVGLKLYNSIVFKLKMLQESL